MGTGPAYFRDLFDRKRSVFSALVGAARARGAPVLTEHGYRSGDTVFYAGNEPFGVYFIHHGVVKLLKSGRAGRMHITYMGGSGDLFGYRALLAGELYKISAVSHHDSKVSFIQRDFFLDHLRGDADLANLLLKMLSVELGDVEDRLVGAVQVGAGRRVARTLRFLASTYGLEGDGRLKIGLSRVDMSELSDTAAETLMRCLGDLERNRLIAREGRAIRILDARGLEEVAGGG